MTMATRCQQDANKMPTKNCYGINSLKIMTHSGLMTDFGLIKFCYRKMR